MLAIILSSLIWQAADGGLSDGTRLPGNCSYPPAVLEIRDGTAFASCNALQIDRDGTKGTSLDFRQRSWGSTMRFTGDMAGDEMRVHRVRLRSGVEVAVSGTCRIEYVRGQVSVVSCLASARGRTYAANFVVSRIQTRN
ncbi:MAG: hypothetical protein AB7F98_03120 [Novosphingobium sp.]